MIVSFSLILIALSALLHAYQAYSYRKLKQSHEHQFIQCENTNDVIHIESINTINNNEAQTTTDTDYLDVSEQELYSLYAEQENIIKLIVYKFSIATDQQSQKQCNADMADAQIKLLDIRHALMNNCNQDQIMAIWRKLKAPKH